MIRSSNGLRRAAAAAVAVLATTGAAASAASAKTLFVSDKGNNANPCSLAHPCKTIARGVGLAHPGDTVLVEKGIYHQNVVIGKDVHVVGVGHPVNNAKGRDNGFVVQGPRAAGAVISGFVIKNAAFEGILVKRTSHVTIINNTVVNNDQGVKAAKPIGECAPSGQIPGDCGEGLHLMTATYTRVIGNVVKNNAGGILLTDEFGPTAHNLIMHNTVLGNVLDCGITVAGHSSKAFAGGKPTPKTGGIYSNAIVKNVANGNGTKGEGAGILLAAGGPGSGVYNNLVLNNTANNNGLAGVTLHSHAPGQDLNGNKILGNKVSHDGVADTSEAEFGATDGKSSVTIGILVGSGVTPLKGTVISGNKISNTHYGIYTKNVPPIKKSSNRFHNVAVPVKQS